MRAGGGDKKSTTAKSGVESFPHPIPDAGKTRDKVGKTFGISGKSVEFGTRVINIDNPKLIKAVDADLIAVSTSAATCKLTNSAPIEAINTWNLLTVGHTEGLNACGASVRPATVGKLPRQGFAQACV